MSSEDKMRVKLLEAAQAALDKTAAGLRKRSISSRVIRTQRIDSHRKLTAMRAAVGKLIDPQTAEITRRYACMFDPYNDGLDLPEELQVVGREEFVRAPGAEHWVHVRDLPESSRNVILDRLRYGKENRDVDPALDATEQQV